MELIIELARLRQMNERMFWAIVALGILCFLLWHKMAMKGKVLASPSWN